MRKGRPHQTTVWVRPKEAQAAKRMKRGDDSELARLKAAKDYRGQHRSPSRDSGSSLADVTEKGTYPKDVYGPKGFRYYGTGSNLDKQAYSVMKSAKGKPDALVTVYRAVPRKSSGGINAGDWVTTVRGYAEEHAAGGDYKIEKKQVRARDIYTNGDSWLEWGYDPKESAVDRQKRLKEEPAEARIARREKVMTKFRRQAPGKGFESKPSKQEVIDILETGRFALVSAGKNPNLEADMSEEAQAERHEKLKQQLVADGYQFTPVEGKYGEEENSFLVWVHDATREDSIKLGEDYNQDSVIYGENGVYESHFTNDAPPSEWDSRGHKRGEVEIVETETWNDQTDEDNYYTKVPLADGTFFKFNLPLYQGLGEPVKGYKPGSRREFLHGVDDADQQEVLGRLAKRKRKRA
jgi:hypothetical protein